MKIFGIGMNKTGTTTLGWCLKKLGYKHVSGSTGLIKMIKLDSDYERFDKIVEENDSFDDLPFNLMYKYLDKKFPNSKFIHTIRIDEETWLDSFKKHCSSAKGNPINRKLMFGYEDVNGNEAEFLKIYREHNAKLSRYFKNKPTQYLKICWEQNDDWNELCNFLDKPIPNFKILKKNVGKG